MAQKSLRVVSYNVENLFYPESDSLHQYVSGDEFTPDGNRRWTFLRYRQKLAHVAQVLTGIGEWDRVAIAGFQEVEEARCLADLTTYNLRSHVYQYLLFEGNDTRGIDVGIIYDTTQVHLLSAIPIIATMSAGERPTRDILYTKFSILYTADSLHVFTCHLPSKLGGAQYSEPRRNAVYAILQQHVDSVLRTDSLANIIVMGDFNSEPKDNLNSLINLMLPLQKLHLGTEKYRGVWTCLDQFYVSSPLQNRVEAHIYNAPYLLERDEWFLGQRPRRTYQGFAYQSDGYSDHLPIYLTLRF